MNLPPGNLILAIVYAARDALKLFGEHENA